jgi:hypothetical protein
VAISKAPIVIRMIRWIIIKRGNFLCCFFSASVRKITPSVIHLLLLYSNIKSGKITLIIEVPTLLHLPNLAKIKPLFLLAFDCCYWFSHRYPSTSFSNSDISFTIKVEPSAQSLGTVANLPDKSTNQSDERPNTD